MVYKCSYSWRNIGYPVKAEDAGTELERIQAKYGEVTPKNLLDESRPVTAVMHNCYEWDDSKSSREVEASAVENDYVLSYSDL